MTTTPAAPAMRRFSCPAGLHPDMVVAADGPQPCPWCEANDLRIDLAELRGVKAERDQLLGRVAELSAALDQISGRHGDPVRIARDVLQRR